MSLERKLRFAARPDEVFLVARAAVLLAAVPPLLKYLKIEKIVRALTPHRPRENARAIPRDRVTYLCHRTLGFAARLSYRPNCLRRTLVHYHCLRLHGAPAVIHFGVKRDGGVLAGHCWLTLDGSLYDERPDMGSQFTQMFALPGPAERSPREAGPITKKSSGERPPDVRHLSFGG